MGLLLKEPSLLIFFFGMKKEREKQTRIHTREDCSSISFWPAEKPNYSSERKTHKETKRKVEIIQTKKKLNIEISVHMIWNLCCDFVHTALFVGFLKMEWCLL